MLEIKYKITMPDGGTLELESDDAYFMWRQLNNIFGDKQVPIYISPQPYYAPGPPPWNIS